MSEVLVNLDKEKFVYDGKEKRPDIEVKDGNLALVKDVDYVINFYNNIDVGQAKIIIKGKGNYSGSITKQFKIIASTDTPKTDKDSNSDKTNKTEQEYNTNMPRENSTVATTTIPKTGITKRLIILGGIIITSIISVCFYVKYKNIKLT